MNLSDHPSEIQAAILGGEVNLFSWTRNQVWNYKSLKFIDPHTLSADFNPFGISVNILGAIR